MFTFLLATAGQSPKLEESPETPLSHRPQALVEEAVALEVEERFSPLEGPPDMPASPTKEAHEGDVTLQAEEASFARKHDNNNKPASSVDTPGPSLLCRVQTFSDDEDDSFEEAEEDQAVERVEEENPSYSDWEETSSGHGGENEEGLPLDGTFDISD